MNTSDLIKTFEQLIFHFLCYVFLSLCSSDTKENETKEKALFPRYFSAKLKNLYCGKRFQSAALKRQHHGFSKFLYPIPLRLQTAH